MKNDGMAIASMVLGIVGIVFFWVPWLCIPCAIVGLILGAVSKRRIAEANGQLGGGGMAVTGIVLSIIALALYVLGLIACASILGSAGLL